MKRVRIVFLSISLVVVMLFTGVLLANRSNQDVLFRALGNLAEVVLLVETEYVNELNQEALSLSLGSGPPRFALSFRVHRRRRPVSRSGRSSSWSTGSTAADDRCGRYGSN
ncbi:MAG: hypothetical protein P8127_15405 [Acidobacteriota bacterium]